MSVGIIARRKREPVPIAYPVIPAHDGGFSWLRTENSRTFIAIAYNAANETLRVVFRDRDDSLIMPGLTRCGSSI